ncbi:MAG: hypothetical protein GXP36_04430 [Actinobacteria bacterium]|uniref:Uncharacterized protein n=1 Tax=hydrothermal vent metagenome TaxID=652676 RepID=A0A3B0SBN8_9ZZZZ|nr:hypothetical protein [Actinomycetota bacterium]
MQRFNELLKQLVDAELVDADLHRVESSLEDRARSHDRLNNMRAEMARLRHQLDSEPQPGPPATTHAMRPNR